MKRFCYLLIVLSIMFVGCKDPNEPYVPSNPDITLTIGNTISDISSVTLTISASGKDLDIFSSWGVTYSETTDSKDGKVKKCTGDPSEGANENVFDGLQENTTY